MRGIIAWFIRYPIWSNVLLLALAFFGYHSLKQMRSSFFPEVESRNITISMTWSGASPEEIEEGVVQRVEESLRGLIGVEQFTSISRENSGVVSVEVSDHYDPNEVLQDVKNAVSRISGYPESAEKPDVSLAKARSRSITVGIAGDADLWVLKERARRFRDDLLENAGVSQVSVLGIPAREISLEVNQASLRAHNINLGEIAAAVQAANLDLSGGKLDTRDEEILIRSYNRENTADALRRLVVRTTPQGAQLRLGDLGEVREQWEDTPNRVYLNGKLAVLVNVDKTIDEDLLHVANTVRKQVEDFKGRFPELTVTVTEDATITLRQRIDLLTSNGAMGLVLVVLSLTFFLNLRISLWVALGIPISFAGMFIVISLVGITINVISLLGMIVVVGMLVDDAIVVAERVYQEYENGATPFQAALDGTMAVISPVITSVLSTMLAFLPFFFLAGNMGNFIWQFALVIIAALFFSLVESFFILPAHLAHSKGLKRGQETNPIRKKLDQIQHFIIHRGYGPVLAFSMRHHWMLLATPVALYLFTMGAIDGGIIQRGDFPNIDADNVSLSIALTTGTQENITDSILRHIETKVWEVSKNFSEKRRDKKPVVLSVIRTIGENDLRNAGPHAGRIFVDLMPAEERNIRTHEFNNALRNSLGEIAGLEKISFRTGHWGKPISVSLLGNNPEELERAKELLKQKLSEYSTIKDVVDSDLQGMREIRLALTPEGSALGFTPRTLAMQVRQAYFGVEMQRVQRGEDEIRLWVRLDENERTGLGRIDELQIQAPNGAWVPLSAVATWTMERGRASIFRLNGRREVRVEADMENPDDSPNAIMAQIRATTVPWLLEQVPSVRVTYAGRERQNQLFFSSLAKAFPPAILAILVLLVLVFRSYTQGLLVLLMIPIGIVGAMWGHWVHGLLISRMSMFGMIALSGIVINGSIVYLDQINVNLRKGMEIHKAIYEGGISRLRPLILTTLTTVLGLGPLILEKSMQAQFLKPLAVSLAYGLMVGSIFILLTLPALFLAQNQIRLLIARLRNPAATAESVEPAVRERHNPFVQEYAK